MPVDLNRCIGCGSCVEDCIRGLFAVEGGKARVQPGICIGCGHCVAICPTGAVRLPGQDDAAIMEYDPAECSVAPEKLLNLMKFRRSVRKFRREDVPEEDLRLLLEAGRHAPTGGNRQKVRYILLRDRRRELTGAALKILHDVSFHMEESEQTRPLLRYREKWRRLYEDYRDRGRDGLFYDAPCVLLAATKEPGSGSGELDCGLASSYIELLAASLGLGACYIGFFSIAAELEPSLAERAGLRPGEKLVSTMALGRPDVRYYRTVERQKADVTVL